MANELDNLADELGVTVEEAARIRQAVQRCEISPLTRSATGSTIQLDDGQECDQNDQAAATIDVSRSVWLIRNAGGKIVGSYWGNGDAKRDADQLLKLTTVQKATK